MQTETNHPHTVQKIARILLKIIHYLLLFIIIIFLLVLTPPVQRFLTGKVENYLENKLETKVEIGSISFGLTGNVSLKDVYIEDRAKDTLLSGGLIKANVEILKLFSNEVEVTDLQFQDITAKIKRTLPDTTFNFQFIVDAFVTEKTANADTAQTAPLKLSIYNLDLDNVNFIYDDVITGNDVLVRIGELNAEIDSLDVYTQHYDIKNIDLKNVIAKIKQVTPLVEPEPVAKDLAEATQPAAMKLDFGTINMDNVAVDYSNTISAFFTNFNIGKLLVDANNIDLQKQVIHLDQLHLNNTTSSIRLGKSGQAEVIEKEVKQEIETQAATNNWVIRINDFEINNNDIVFDNDNSPRTNYGIDYAHLNAEDLTLHVDDFIFNTDSIGGLITQGTFKEKNGFVLNELRGNVLYANNQSYLKDLYIKTPGTEIKRNAVLTYASFDALVNNFEKTQIDIDIINSYIQVKDILAFAPQLRSEPAFRNTNDVWRLNLQGSGNFDRLHLSSFQFAGLQNTRININGTLANLTDPNAAGGTLTIHQFHTTQSDLSLIAGQSLSNDQLNLPETFDVTGTLSGNAANLSTNLQVSTSSGNVAVNGRFNNLTNPNTAKYNAAIRTSGLRLGSILRNPELGVLSANLNIAGSGFTPETMNTRVNGNIYSVGYNNYTYSNISLNGSINKNVFDIKTDIRDPNASLNASVSGTLSDNPSFRIDAFVDSFKALPLNFTTEPLTFRGKIEGEVASLNPDYLEADVLVTNALLVSGKDRLPMDTVALVAGRSDTGQYIRLNSDIINAQMEGEYRFADLGNIFLNNIDPYFSVTPAQQAATVQPYDIQFTADIVYSPVLSSFVPGFQSAETIHASGSLATNQGLNANVTAPYILFQDNEINNLNLNVNTSDSGMRITGNVDHLKSSAFDVYNVQVNALALNDVVDFDLGIDDRGGRDKYFIGGTLTQPSQGNMTIRLDPQNLLLNYDSWSVPADNSISIVNNNILANNFILQRGAQQLSIQSVAGAGSPLDVNFTSFRLGTITGFLKSDTAFVDGLMNGNVRLSNIMEQPVFTSNLTINDLSFKQDTVGNVNIQVNNTTANRYNTDVTITGRGNDLAVTGYFTQQANDIALNLDLAIRSLQLNTLEGAMSDFMNSASGSINGKVSINGTASQPQIRGNLSFDTATINTVALGGPFTIDDETLSVTETGLSFNNFSIRDSANNPLTLNGSVRTTNFVNYRFGLNVTSRNFRAINTTKTSNSIYYGDLTLSTDLHIGGTEKQPVIDGSITIGEGTNFSIVLPQAEPGVVQREGIVEFVDFETPENDSMFLAYDSLNYSSLIGFDVAANIEIQKEASFNVIVDVANGDFLNLKGEGLLSAGIDPSGKITLTGSYEIVEGGYQLSFNFLKRRFEIQKGSKITWLGEPTNAQLDVTAIYVANTAPLDLVENQIATAQRNYYLQKLPFQVLLNLDGELMKPVISFDIVLPEGRNYNVTGDVVTNVRTRLEQIRQEPSELNKQVFAVLLLNRFVGENPFQSSGGGFNAGSFARQSVSKLLTEQLNNLAGDLIGGVELNFDVASSDDYTTGERRSRTDLNVGLSKRLLNDRLTITVGNNFQLEGPQQSNQASNNIAGNVAVNYQLSKDGRYMLRFYRKNEYEGLVDGYVIETGLGFIMTVDYNRFSEIFEARRIKRSEKRKAEENQNQSNDGQSK